MERRYGRSTLNSLHDVWSIGAVVGGLIAAAPLIGTVGDVYGLRTGLALIPVAAAVIVVLAVTLHTRGRG
ncbi:hypothetical protein ALI22I_29585 [Saccharothrix sp. ALI-22-I]|nr:hypothetical protein ALI22I_29585 [Saccharothrix sp. ALI-22-I]